MAQKQKAAVKVKMVMNLMVNFLPRFVCMFFVLGPSSIRNAKAAAALHCGGKFKKIFYSAQGMKPSLPSTCTLV